MTLPRNYDEMHLSGPEEPDEPQIKNCPNCHGHGAVAIIEEPDLIFPGKKGVLDRGPDLAICETCDGTGEVEADADEYENERGDWLRDRRDGR
jgi:DnaJ-class molecular chaperone